MICVTKIGINRYTRVNIMYTNIQAKLGDGKLEHFKRRKKRVDKNYKWGGGWGIKKNKRQTVLH